MAINYTSLLALIQPVDGTEVSVWGDDVNNGVSSILDVAVAGTQNITTDANVTLTITQATSSGTNLSSTSAQYAILLLSGARTATRAITLPASSKTYTVMNSTTGGYAQTVGGLTIAVGEYCQIAYNTSSSSWVKTSTFSGAGVFSSFTNTSLTSGRVVYSTTGGLETDSANLTFDGTNLGLAGGTANGVAYLNGSKVLTTGSALTFDGSQLVNTGGALLVGLVASTGTTGTFRAVTTSGGNYIQSSTNNGGGAFSPLIFTDNGASNEYMRLTSTGLGIGTSSPTAALDVVKASFTGGPLIGARYNTSNLRMGIGIGNNNGFPFLGVNVNNAANDNGTFDINSWASRLRMDNGLFQFQTSSASGTAGGAITWNTYTTIDSSGNLGLGVTPSGAWGTQALMFGKTGAGSPTYPFIATINTQDLTIGSNTYWNGSVWKAQFPSAVTAMKQTVGYNAITWETAAAVTQNTTQSFSTAMTLDNSGHLLVGVTSASSGLFYIRQDSSTLPVIQVQNENSTAKQISFRTNGNSEVGSITTTFSGTAYNTTSDQRLKENIVDAPEFGSVIDSIQVRSYDWKADHTHQRAGFIAQELVTVAPEAVYQPEDPEEMMAVDYSKLVPMLVKEVQSLRARLKAANIA